MTKSNIPTSNARPRSVLKLWQVAVLTCGSLGLCLGLITACMIVTLPAVPAEVAANVTPMLPPTDTIFPTKVIPTNTIIPTEFIPTDTIIPTQTLLVLPSDTPLPTDLPSPTPLSIYTAFPCLPRVTPEKGVVVNVFDARSIEVAMNNQNVMIEYIGLGTFSYGLPEITAGKMLNQQLVAGQTILLIPDTQDTGINGQHMRYVIANDIFVNYEIIQQGLAPAQPESPNLACAGVLNDAQIIAQAQSLGLWNYQAIAPTSPPLTGGNAGSDVPCNCNGPDKNCSDFGDQAAAQSCFERCRSRGLGDIFGLDRDNDGLACEDD